MNLLLLKLQYCFFAIFFLLSACTPNLDLKKKEISEGDLKKLIQQLEHGNHYWGSKGEGLWVTDMNMIGATSYRLFAAAHLGTLAENGANVDAAVPALIRSLKYRRSEYVSDYGLFPIRAASAHTLGAIKDPKAIDGLIELYRENDRCFSNIELTPLCDYLSAKDLQGDISGNQMTQDLIRGILGRKRAAVFALGEIGIKRPDVINLLMSALKDKDSSISYASAVALAMLGEDNKAIDSLTIIIQTESDPSMKSNASEAIGAFGVKAQRAVPVLIKEVGRNANPEEAIMALKNIGTPDAINALNKLVKSRNHKISKLANDALDTLKRDKIGSDSSQ